MLARKCGASLLGLGVRRGCPFAVRLPGSEMRSRRCLSASASQAKLSLAVSSSHQPVQDAETELQGFAEIQAADSLAEVGNFRAGEPFSSSVVLVGFIV